jgi:hypothetical protein
MILFAETFPDRQIVQTLSGQSGWNHFIEIIPIAESLKRELYAALGRLERWGIRTLCADIDGLLYEVEQRTHPAGLPAVAKASFRSKARSESACNARLA